MHYRYCLILKAITIRRDNDPHIAEAIGFRRDNGSDIPRAISIRSDNLYIALPVFNNAKSNVPFLPKRYKSFFYNVLLDDLMSTKINKKYYGKH
jgi:hypothetical protein